ncbi:PTB domain-containing engulfment adapter protein 1 isoform X6 [Scophthalmus maximus]|uniref:PTB domain-containing engulfment adapter protein 1 isoform X6 n=1 Tax=Scophthalmus maximus TaxID=52904 RepID=UPI001FA906FB|nr:PTB domain-containing engulfment adapter protein 1 isoform X6 [Scophthalmus maximus]
MSSIMCQGKSFLLSLQTPSSLLAAVLSVPPSGPQLKTIKICWNFLLTILPQFEGGILAVTQEGPLETHIFSTMNRAFNRKKDKSWMHTPEALAKHYIPYNAKFLGNTEVEAPKGTEVVKDAVRKLKFQRHIKKSEGQKTPKAELQISIYGVKILDPKTKDVQHNCQLHRISFCADDKTDKRIFTFICKDSESNKHLCYVFDSEKCAEEITLTIGQAFDLAYKKFLESGGKDVETRKQIGSLQKRIQELETENSELKQQLQDLEEQLMIAHVPPAGSISMKPQSTDVFDMVPFSPVTPLVPTVASNGCPPPPPTTLPPDIRKDLFGAEPFDPFTCGAADFPPDIQSKLDEMQTGPMLLCAAGECHSCCLTCLPGGVQNGTNLGGHRLLPGPARQPLLMPRGRSPPRTFISFVMKKCQNPLHR